MLKMWKLILIWHLALNIWRLFTGVIFVYLCRKVNTSTASPFQNLCHLPPYIIQFHDVNIWRREHGTIPWPIHVPHLRRLLKSFWQLLFVCDHMAISHIWNSDLTANRIYSKTSSLWFTLWLGGIIQIIKAITEKYI